MPTAAELPIDTSATALDMADAVFGNGISIVSASYTGVAGASGIYTDGDATAPGITRSDTGVILSTGMAQDITNATCDVNQSAATSTMHWAAGDAHLTGMAGMQTFDAAVLEADFIPDGSTLTMQIVFSSEEYLEYVNSGFNDVVGVIVNGQPAQLTVGTGDVSIDNINDAVNSNLYVDNAATDDTYNTEMDGFTVTLTLKAPVYPGVVNTIKIGIADGGDDYADSNLLIAGDLVQTALVAGDDDVTVTLGAQSGADLLANDSSTTGSQLSITHINGQPVNVGDIVELPTGEMIEMTGTGFIMASASDTPGENSFSYTVSDELGNTDVGFVNLTTVPCFVAGTLIATPDGPRCVENLRPGDRVITLDNAAQPLIWVGQTLRPAQGPDAPIAFTAGRFGATRATRVSPQHRILLQGAWVELLFALPEVLARAKHLGKPALSKRLGPAATVLYVHLMFRQHEIVFGDGMPSENYQPGDQTHDSFGARQRSEMLRALRCHGATNMHDARPTLTGAEARMFAALSAAPRPSHERIFQPVRKIHQIAPRHRQVNPAIARSDRPTGTSAMPKNAQRNPEIR